jgi:hypothetical protein
MLKAKKKRQIFLLICKFIKREFDMEERKRILNMLKNGKISEDEAERLLDAIKEDSSSSKENEDLLASKPVTNTKNLTGKLCIEIDSNDDDHVSVKIPLKLAPLGLKMMPKDTYDKVKKSHGIDLADLLNNLDEVAGELDDDLINITSGEGDKVRIYIKK